MFSKKHYWTRRYKTHPVKVTKKAKNMDVRNLSLHMDEMARILDFKRKIAAYIVGNYPNFRDGAEYHQPHGILIYKLIKSYVYIRHAGNYNYYYLAHELFHEYQRENGIRYTSDEECEMEAEAFAVAYIENTPLFTGEATARRVLIPKKIRNKYISDLILSKVGVDGVPIKIREVAERFKQKYW